MTRSLFLVGVLVVGCKRPPDAPNELNQLTGYLFVHAADDDHTELKAGFDNLRPWLEKRLEDTTDGYTVNNLSQNEVNTLDACEGVGQAVQPREGCVPRTVGEAVQVLAHGWSR